MTPHDYSADGDFRLLSAKFGSGNSWADVLERIGPKILGPFVPFGWEYWELPDPCCGKEKSLVIRFLYQGKEIASTIAEGQATSGKWACLLPNAAAAYFSSLMPGMLEPLRRLPAEHSVSQLEEAIVASGLSNCSNNSYPQRLQPFLGKGLGIWQYPAQFAPYLMAVREIRPASYLEIGIRFGGTFAFTAEYLRLFGRLERAAGVDLLDSPFARGYAASTPSVRLVVGDSHDERTIGKEGFDLVLLDGDHYQAGLEKDFELYSPGCKAVAVHDICDQGFDNGAIEFWKRLKAERAGEFGFKEFVSQYPEITAFSGGKTLFGIGLATRR